MAIYNQLIYLLKMLMFHSYISLPEGNPHCESAHIIPFFVADHQLIDQTTPRPMALLTRKILRTPSGQLLGGSSRE